MTERRPRADSQSKGRAQPGRPKGGPKAARSGAAKGKPAPRTGRSTTGTGGSTGRKAGAGGASSRGKPATGTGARGQKPVVRGAPAARKPARARSSSTGAKPPRARTGGPPARSSRSGTGGTGGSRSGSGTDRSSSGRTGARGSSRGASSAASRGAPARRDRASKSGGPRPIDVRPSGATWRPDRTKRRDAPASSDQDATAAPRRRAPQDFATRRPAPLRVVKGSPRPATPAAKTRKRARPAPAPGRERRRARGPGPKAVREEFQRLGGPRGAKFYEQLVRAADALAADREKDALRLLRPLRAALPQSATVHEQMGIALYRSGRYDQAAEELEAYVALCGAVDQHPALMDCYRALKQWKRVEALWEELGQTAAAPDVVAEGRIVFAGSLADRGRIKEAISLLERRGADVKNVQDFHLRLWYALADLQERAGNLPRARTLFERISRTDPGFADVMERIVSLG